MPTAIPVVKEPVVTEPIAAAAVTTEAEQVSDKIDSNATTNSGTSSIDDDIAVSIPAAISEMTSVATSRKDPPMTPSVCSPTTRSQTLPKSRKRTTPDKYVPTMVTSPRKNLDYPSSKRSKVVPKTTASNKEYESDSDVEEIDDDETTVEEVKDAVSTIDIELLKKYERDLIKKKSKAALQEDNILLNDEADLDERNFLKLLFELKVRNESRISWAGFLLGYVREIKLTEYGIKYMKTRKYIFRHLFCNNILF